MDGVDQGLNVGIIWIRLSGQGQCAVKVIFSQQRMGLGQSIGRLFFAGFFCGRFFQFGQDQQGAGCQRLILRQIVEPGHEKGFFFIAEDGFGHGRRVVTGRRQVYGQGKG